MGKPGIFSIQSVLEKNLNSVERVLSYFSLTDAEDELLYGNAGYLYCLLFILKYWPDVPVKFQITQALNQTAQKLIKIGDKSGVLSYQFPRGKTEYIGAAHGSIGVLHMLLLSRQYLGKVNDIYMKNTLNYIISLQFESGNFPATEEDPNDRLVHFCHGGPGAVPMLCKAYELLKDARYLEAAVRSGDDI